MENPSLLKANWKNNNGILVPTGTSTWVSISARNSGYFLRNSMNKVNVPQLRTKYKPLF